jgi:hypothetical protein
MATTTIAVEHLPRKNRATGEELSNELHVIDEGYTNLVNILLGLMPNNSHLVVGSNGENEQTYTYNELVEKLKMLQKQTKITSQRIKQSVRKTRKPVDGQESIQSTNIHNLSEGPRFYQRELIDFFLKADLGKVDSNDPKSQNLAEYLKNSVFGKTNIATQQTFTLLFPIYVNVNKLKNPTDGRIINIPRSVFEKQLKSVYSSLKDSVDFDAFRWTTFQKITAAEYIRPSALDQRQKETLESAAVIEQAKEVKNVVARALASSKVPKNLK